MLYFFVVVGLRVWDFGVHRIVWVEVSGQVCVILSLSSSSYSFTVPP